MSRPPRARERVLDAAERVLLVDGATAFTLDAVAARAEVSKGGLLYHFPSKEALLAALVERAVATVDSALEDAAHATAPGAFAHAYLDATIPAEARPADAGAAPDAPTGIEAALAVAVALDPALLGPLRAAYGRWQVRLEADGLDPALATLVRLAVDGWWLAALLDLPPLRPDLHRDVRAALERLATPASSSPSCD